MQRPPAAAPPPRRPHILLALTGSVAAMKAPDLARALGAWGEVRTLATEAALHFFDPASLPPPARPVLRDGDEWAAWRGRGDPVLHIELRRWADVLVVAPLSAHALASTVAGLAGGLVPTVLRAWEWGAKPVLLAPAMNTAMWDHPVTAGQVATLEEWGAVVVPPIAKALACGDEGVGAMAEPGTVAEAARRLVGGGGRGR
jgi:phosphopantothenoylcysteine decarboxylase